MTVHADIGDLIFIVIVIASVIGQIVKGAKKVAAQAPGKGGKPSPASDGGRPPQRQQDSAPDPAEALQDFFRSLNGQQPAAAPPPLPPPTTGTPQQRRNRIEFLRLQQERRRHTRRVAPPVPVATVAVAPVAPQTYEDAAGMSHGVEHVELVTGFAAAGSTVATTGEQSLASTLRRELSTKDTARRAMILREILGPPLALR